MPSVKRQKLDRDNTAAYAVSQPLFEAIKSARDILPQQGIGLRTAQDITKDIHVGLHIQDGTHNIEKHIKYMDSIIDSWRIVTDSYCSIFAQLTLVTGEKPTEGKPAAKAHPDLLKIYEAALQAQRTAREYVTLKDRPDIPKAEAMEVSSEDESSKHKPASSAPATPTPSSRKTPKGVKYDRSGSKILWRDGQLRVPFTDLDKQEKQEWKLAEKLHKRQQQKGKVAAIKKEHEQKTNSSTAANGPSSAQPEQANVEMADAEFEDAGKVSAEVEARLQAKQAAKRAKKAERKRKRESVESFVNGDDAHEPVPAAEKKLSEKPSKKKLKNEAGGATVVNGSSADGGQNEKRKTSADATSATSGAGKVSKKRKKNKN